MIEEHLSIVLGILSLMSTVILLITFFNKLKWTQEQHEKRFKTLETDVNNLGSKLNGLVLVQQTDVKDMLVKVDAIDKSVISMAVSIGYIKEVIQELKDRK